MSSVVCFGNFDGLHLGHIKLLTKVLDIAKTHGLESAVITFDNHPRQILASGENTQILLPAKEKRLLLRELGLDVVDMLHSDETLFKISAEEFLRDYIVSRHDPAYIVAGHDSLFGHQRKGNESFLRENAEVFHYNLITVEPEKNMDQIISSSYIRSLLTAGNLNLANKLLGRPYTLFGTVVTGLGLGHKLGFPTANLKLAEPVQLVPRSGIYLCRVLISSGAFFGLTNIGISPTVKSSGIIEIETHILDFDNQITGKKIRIELLKYLREEKMFADEHLLTQAIRSDLVKARQLIDVLKS